MPESAEPRPVPNPRLRRFAHAVASGYAQLVANVLYVLASVPLALHFLEKREFGLWALAVQLGGYLQLIDFGMSSSVSRHLIDHKDAYATGEYGGMIKTGAAVLTLQGFMVLLGGCFIVLFGTAFLRIDPDLEHIFKVVMILQCAIIAADFPARLFNHILTAHQRADVANYSQIGSFITSFAVLWYSMAHSAGLLSLVWANAAGWLISTITGIASCVVLEFFPARGTWGKATWSKFQELFRFGRDIFWIALGTQMIMASQTIIITRSLGLIAAATWSVCTRAFTLANQLIWRPFDLSYPMLSEMVARGEKERLLLRFRNLVTLTVSFAAIGAIIFAACNQPFVALWTRGKIGWPSTNDTLLGIWMVQSSIVHCLCSLPGIIKRVGFMRYIYFLEGVAYIMTASLLGRIAGFEGVIVASILCTGFFSFAYSIWRTADYFRLPFQEVALGWLKPSIRLIVVVAPIGLGIAIASIVLDPAFRLALRASTIGLIGALLLLRVGIPEDLKHEIRNRAPGALRRLLTVALGTTTKGTT